MRRTDHLASATAPATAPAPAAVPSGRDRALDLFRGATVAGMILVNNPGSWQHLYPPLAHAPWHGWTATDLVFPFFLFAVGWSLAVVTPGLLALPPAAFWRKWLTRGLGIVAIGLALNALSLPKWEAGQLVLRGVDDWRWMGVLQRIGLAWMAAAALLRAARGRPGMALAAAAALLLGYAGLCLGFAQGPDPYSLEGFFGTALDRAVLGPRHLYQGEGVPFDPEGLASTLPAIAQVLLGWWLGGRLLRAAPQGVGPLRCWRLAPLLGWALALGLLAQAWALAVPINKKLWTPPYVLHTTACALALLALGWALGWALARVWPRRPGRSGGLAEAGWPLAMVNAYGRNALAIFVLSGLVPRLLALVRLPDGLDPATGLPRRITPLAWVFREVALPLAGDPRLASLAMALAQVVVYGGLAMAMARRGWFIRL